MHEIHFSCEVLGLGMAMANENGAMLPFISMCFNYCNAQTIIDAPSYHRKQIMILTWWTHPA